MKNKRLIILLSLVINVSFISPQSQDIIGNVTDRNQEPLVEVSVNIKGTTTDIDEKFSISNV